MIKFVHQLIIENTRSMVVSVNTSRKIVFCNLSYVTTCVICNLKKLHVTFSSASFCLHHVMMLLLVTKNYGFLSIPT